MKKIIAWLRLIRPPIIFISALGAIVGALNSANFLNDKLSFFEIAMIIFGASFLSAGLMVHNDVTDLKSDEVNRPNKPLPSKIIKLKTAYITGILLMILAIFIALLININDSGQINYRCGFLTLFLVVLGIYYNHYGKHLGIYGNIAVSIGVGAIPFWGSAAAFPSELFIMFPLALSIFIMEIGREIMVNAGDYFGDLKAGFKTLPVKIGRKKSMHVALMFYIAFIPIFPLPAFDYLGLGVPQVFGSIYLIGGTVLALSLLITWFLTYIVLLQKDENKIWSAFERYKRTGTRVMIIVFQFFLLLEVFY